MKYRFSSSQIFMARTLAVLLWLMILGAIVWSPLVVSWLWQRKSITLFVPPLVIDPLVIKQFEEETGIRVHIAYFENPIALLSKMNASQGRGYDVVLTEDHALHALIGAHLVDEVQAEQVPFMKKIDPTFGQNYYDPGLHYSIPYYSIVYGIAYHTKIAAEAAADPHWSFIFNPPPLLHHRICMTDDPREALLLATFYAKGVLEDLRDVHTQQEVVHILRTQKKYVDVYSLERADNLMQTESCLAAVMASSDYWRIKAKYPFIEFMVPEEGSFKAVYSFAIVQRSEKKELAYHLIRYLFQAKVLHHHMHKFGYLPSITSVLTHAKTPPSFREYGSRPLFFFEPVVSDRLLNDLWIQVLS